MRVLMLVATPVVADARVLREARALAEAGHEVHVVGRDVPVVGARPDGVVLHDAAGGRGLRPSPGRLSPPTSAPARLARWALLPQHRNRTFRTWASRAERAADGLSPDVVHAHDFTALEVGERLARRNDVPLVYDSHELWSGRHRTGRPTPWQSWHEARVERRLGSAAAAVLTVSDALADRLHERYGWDHVTVVRNSFPASSRPPDAAPPPEVPSAAVYAGRVAGGRDLETVAAASRLADLPVRLVGPVDTTWLAGFDPGRASVEPAVPPSEVDALLCTAGLALVTLEPTSPNHQVALPNKLFQAVQAGVPLVATDVGELGRCVREHGLGTLYRAGDAHSLADALAEAMAVYPALCRAVRGSAQHLRWEDDRSALLSVYDGLTT